ncbi:IGK protein, partial [Cinclus mexicanus]|nr:IGK protein [Cinclus mexicanus]
IIHWYKQKEGEAPERLLFVSGSKVTVESGFKANRYLVERNSVQKWCVLTIKDVIPDDDATYYCAYWDPHSSDIVKALFTVIGYYNKVFGSGTKLFVSDKPSFPPANSEILQKKHENQTMYVCLIEKFYPEVIRVTWADDEKEVTDNVVKGDIWNWLTVPAENKDKKYYCRYEHEKGKASLPTQEKSNWGISTLFPTDSLKTPPQEEVCRTVFNRGNLILFCLVFVTDQLMHRTAYLVYIILLLKSSMYYLIVLFFIYK